MYQPSGYTNVQSMNFLCNELCDLPTGGGMTCVSTFTSTTASMTVLLCRLDKALIMALAASWICPRSPSFARPSCSKDWRDGEEQHRRGCREEDGERERKEK